MMVSVWSTVLAERVTLISTTPTPFHLHNVGRHDDPPVFTGCTASCDRWKPTTGSRASHQKTRQCLYSQHPIRRTNRQGKLKFISYMACRLTGQSFYKQDTITRLLYSLGSKREVERHLRIFSSASHPSEPAKFAVIKIGGAVLADVDELALNLSFLYRVGLYPVILHGGGPQLNDIMEREGVIPDYIDGIRVTGPHLFHLLLICDHKFNTPSRRQNAQHRS